MENINIKALMKSEAYTEAKVSKTSNKENNNEFSKIINKKLSEKENSTKAVAIHKDSEKSSAAKEPKIKDAKVEADGKPEEPKLEENANEQLMLLMQLLMGLGDKTGIQDTDKLKEVISELLQSNISEKNNNILDLNLINLKKLDINDLINTENNLKQQLEVLASQIAEKLSSDPDFRTQLISKLSGEFQGAAIDESKDIKQAIIKELSSLLKQSTNSIPENQTINNIQAIEKTETEANRGFTEESDKYKPEVDNKTVNKEDKLLKDLLSEDGTKDRIANVVTRLEVIRNDKPVAVEAQLTINRNNLNTDFIKAVKFMDMNNIKELSVKILPKDLGEIVIRLSMDNGVMKANISATNKETYNLLNSQLTAISNQLADQNMNIQSFNLSLYNGDNFLFSGNGNDQGERKQHGKKAAQVDGIDTDETPVQGYDAEESNINALA